MRCTLAPKSCLLCGCVVYTHAIIVFTVWLCGVHSPNDRVYCAVYTHAIILFTVWLCGVHSPNDRVYCVQLVHGPLQALLRVRGDAREQRAANPIDARSMNARRISARRISARSISARSITENSMSARRSNQQHHSTCVR